MPYVHCPGCRGEFYSAAAWTTHDECPSCLAPLVPERGHGPGRATSSWLAPGRSDRGAQSGADTQSLDVRVPGGPSAPAEARAAVSAWVGSDLDDDRLDDLLILTSEVVSNAVVHAGAGPGREVGLLVARAVETLRVTVSDPGPDFSPRERSVAPVDAGGMGLVLVELLAERWGVERRDERTKDVWFEFLVRQVDDGTAERGERPHLECPGCGLRLYTAEAWATLERCPRCHATFTRHPPVTRSLKLPRPGGQGQDP